MNMNEWAVEVSKVEGKKVQLSIAQIKETLACVQKIAKARGKNFYRWLKTEVSE